MTTRTPRRCALSANTLKDQRGSLIGTEDAVTPKGRTMGDRKSGPEEAVSGAVEDAKGKVKEAAGTGVG